MAKAAEQPKCPTCGGSLTWNFASRSLECKTCRMSVTEPVKASDKPAKSQSPKPSPQKVVVTSSDPDTVIESYTETLPNGETAVKVVKRVIPKRDARYIPDIELHEPRANFEKQFLRDRIEQEKRWGRDHLRKLRDTKQPYDVISDAVDVVRRASTRRHKKKPNNDIHIKEASNFGDSASSAKD